MQDDSKAIAASLSSAPEIGDHSLRLEGRELASRAVILLSHELGGPISVLNGYAAMWADGDVGADPESPFVETVRSQAAILARALFELLDALRDDPETLSAPVAAFEAAAGPVIDRLATSFEDWLARNRDSPAGSVTLVQTCLAKVHMLAGLIEQLSLAVGTRDVVWSGALCVDVSRWLRQVVHTIAASVAATGHSVIVGSTSGPVVMSIFPSLLEAAILNLVDNAQKFSPPGTPIVLAVERCAERVVVKVSDRGPGLPEAMTSEPFSRVDHPSAFQAPGLGLGLMIAARIATAHDGELWYADRPGGGATFGIALPAEFAT